MKRYICLLTVLFLVVTAFPQTQQGYVKTKGRMDAKGNLIPGQGLKGATVSIKGRTTILVNADDGAFSFPVPNIQFCVDSVRKKGYQLVDMEACPRSYKFSSNPIYIVMETPEQQLQDKLNAERKIRRNLQKQLQEKEDEIEDLKAKQKISDEEYRQALQKLYQDQENNEQLISDMAKRYSELDYDQLDEFYRQVSYSIENGELVKADSLLRTKGDVTQQVVELLKRGKAIQEQQEMLDKAKTVHVSDQDELARRCYSYYETFAARHLNDTAAYYLELRASLDTTNLNWQKMAGTFICDCLADYDKAMFYYERAYNQALLNSDNRFNSIINHDIGLLLWRIGNYQKSIEHLQTAIDIEENIGNSSSSSIASIYNDIGNVYGDQGDYIKALEYYNKALDIREESFGRAHPETAETYFNIATIYHDLYKDYNKSIQYINKALTIFESTYGAEHQYTAYCYMHLGENYSNQANYKLANDCFEKALAIQKSIYGTYHPEIAHLYIKMAQCYHVQSQDSLALCYYDKALTIRKMFFGTHHPFVANVYGGIANLYCHNDFCKAEEFYNKELEILKEVYGSLSQAVGDSYNELGKLYNGYDRYDKAIEYHNKALEIRKKLYGESHPKVSASYFNLALVYEKSKDYPKAIEYYEKAYLTDKEVFGIDHRYTLEDKEKLENIKVKMKEQGNE